MFTSFDTLPAHARLWIYQADRSLNDQEVFLCEQMLRDFTHNWAAHGVPLKASFQILYSRFIILSVDQAHHEPSGCSIDASVAVIRELERALDISLLNRSLVPFKKDGKVVAFPLKELKKMVEAGEITAETPTFNTLATAKGELAAAWEMPAQQSWLARYFK